MGGGVITYLIILFLLVVPFIVGDLFIHRNTLKDAVLWGVFWVLLSLGFNGWIYYELGATKALEFFTGYIIEKSLSLDNIFLFVLIFKALKVPADLQHRVLFWGIFTAFLIRGALIYAGTAFMNHFEWIGYALGLLLIGTAYKILTNSQESFDKTHFLIQYLTKILPFTPDFHGKKFIHPKKKGIKMTPLFLALVSVEVVDVIFAMDSLPAVFSITNDSFIIYSSNVFALLGLRSLYCVIEKLLAKLVYLKIGLAFILAFVGIKMLIHKIYTISPLESLSVILGILGITIIVSLRSQKLPSLK